MIDDKFVLKSRALYDLGTFVRDYNIKLSIKNRTVGDPPEEDLIEEHREEREEFLTDEDYLKYGRI